MKLSLKNWRFFNFSEKINKIISVDNVKEFINQYPKWMYEFDLGKGIKTPIASTELAEVHKTRENLIFPVLDNIFKDMWGTIDCLDVACNEGYYSMLLYNKGTKKVLGIDIREKNIERANFIKNYFGFEDKRIDFKQMDLFELVSDKKSKFDLVMFLGVLYHLENPMGALRLLRRMTKRVLVVETQLTRFNKSINSGWGTIESSLNLPASLAIYQETDSETNLLASSNSLSFIPNKEAVIKMLNAAGFSKVTMVEPRNDSNKQYQCIDRAIFFAYVEDK